MATDITKLIHILILCIEYKIYKSIECPQSANRFNTSQNDFAIRDV